MSFNPTLVRLRLVQPLEALAGLPGFNPTLVRLRHCPSHGLRQLPSCFNPTLVRLRLPIPRRGTSPSPSFQSHAGSIEARILGVWQVEPELSFNPTLVRLRRGGWAS